MKKILLVSLLIMSLLLCLCACGEGEVVPTTDTTATTEAPTKATDPTKPDPIEPPIEAFDGYTITVVDEEGNPVSDAIVQMCLEACVPGFTDANGVATFNLPEDDYKVSFVKIPEGYALAGEEENFYFEDGSKEMTIILKAAA